MMNLNKEINNTSLSSLSDYEETLNSNAVPVRNAISSIKRSREPSRIGRLSFKPMRLTDLTQEWLEAENEPLKEASESEEVLDGDTDTHSDDKQLIEGLVNSLIGCKIESPRRDEGNVSENERVSIVGNNLGVNWLETPAKTQPRVEHEGVCAIRSKINCAKLPTTPSIIVQEFVTPYTLKTIKSDKCASKPKIQFSMDTKGLLRTPVYNFGVTNGNHNCQSLTKVTAQHNPAVFRNISSDDAQSQRINNEQTLKCNLKNPSSVLHEKNKENVPKNVNSNRVQFSLPATEFNDEIFKVIKVKTVTYIILSQLGTGGSSVVYHCYDPKTKAERAIKKVNLVNDVSAVGYINEVKVLERLQKCNRIIKMFDYEIIESEKLLLVVLERGGLDLSKILKDLSNASRHLPMHLLIFYWMEMLYAVKQIHDNGIVHSDLKPANFLQAGGALKLIDFGIASCIQEDMTSVVRNVQVGSFNYISPEALTNESSNNCGSPSFEKPKYKVSYKSDVWSLGCILYQLVYRRTPFQHIGHMWGKLSAILDPEHKIDYPEVDWVPFGIVNTIKNCLQHDMKARPSVDELIQVYESIYN